MYPALRSAVSRSTLRSLPLKRFLECPLTAPLPLTRFSARSVLFSAPFTPLSVCLHLFCGAGAAVVMRKGGESS